MSTARILPALALVLAAFPGAASAELPGATGSGVQPERELPRQLVPDLLGYDPPEAPTAQPSPPAEDGDDTPLRCTAPDGIDPSPYLLTGPVPSPEQRVAACLGYTAPTPSF